MQLKCGARRCHATIIWPHKVIRHFLSGAFCYTLFGIKAQFIIRKEELPVLAHRASYDKKTLARHVISLAPGYRTALWSSPESVVFVSVKEDWTIKKHKRRELPLELKHEEGFSPCICDTCTGLTFKFDKLKVLSFTFPPQTKETTPQTLQVTNQFWSKV